MRSIKSMIIVTATALSLCFMAPAIFAAGGKGQGACDGSGPIHSIIDGTPVEIVGVVASIGTQGTGIGIDNGVEIVTVFGLGPVAFWNAAGIERPEIGEDITINGYEITLSDGSTMIIAESVIIGGEEIILRDPETGAPLWRGMNSSAGAEDNGCLMSALKTQTKDRKKDGSCLLPLTDSTTDAFILARGGNGNGGGRGGHGPGDGTGNGGNGPKDGSGFGSKSGTCVNT